MEAGIQKHRGRQGSGFKAVPGGAVFPSQPSTGMCFPLLLCPGGASAVGPWPWPCGGCLQGRGGGARVPPSLGRVGGCACISGAGAARAPGLTWPGRRLSGASRQSPCGRPLLTGAGADRTGVAGYREVIEALLWRLSAGAGDKVLC